MKALKRIDSLLKEKCCKVSKQKGDEYNNFLFSQMATRLTESERRNCNVYLFGAMYDRMDIADLEMI
jgi:hypothetical protein